MSRIHVTATAAGAALAAACPALLMLSTPAHAEPAAMPLSHSGPLAQILNHNGNLSRSQAQTALHAQFEKLDANHDGVISSSEFIDPRMAMFDSADVNSDGELSLAEMRAYALSVMRAHDGEPAKPR